MRPVRWIICISLLVMAALMMAAFFATPVSAQVGSTSTVDSVGDVGQFSSIAIDSKGFAHMVYYNATSHSLMYATNEWGYWVTVVAALGNDQYWKGEWCSIAIDSNDDPHVSYCIYEVATQDSWVGYRWFGSGPGTEEVLFKEAGHYNGFCTDIAIDSQGYAHVVSGEFYGGYAQLLYARQGSPINSPPGIAHAWTGTIRINPLSSYGVGPFGGWYNSIDVGPNDLAQISTMMGPYSVINSPAPSEGAPPGLGPYSGLWHLRASASGFIGTQISSGDVGFGSQIAVDEQNRAFISYQDNTTGSVVYAHQEAAGGAFTITPILDHVAGGYTGIALDAQGQVYVSYQRIYGSGMTLHNHIEVAAFRNDAWTYDEVDQGSIF
jgi:hypothetical protein